MCVMVDLRKVCMCAYFPNTIEPCRKSIRDGELNRTLESWLSCLRYVHAAKFAFSPMYHILMVNKSKVWLYSTNNVIFPNK